MEVKKRKVTSIVLFVVLITTFFSAVWIGSVSAQVTWYVDDVPGIGPGNPAEDFTSIQAAINAASPGDIIYIYSGGYVENVVVDKSLTLQGEDRATTVVSGGGFSDVFHVIADWVNITGLKVMGSGINSGDAGIELHNVGNCTIFENDVTWNNNHGIFLNSSSFNHITDNTISNNVDGVHLYFSNENDITGNTATDNVNGIHLKSSFANFLQGNIASYNMKGIFLFYSSDNDITNNFISYNENGIHLQFFTWTNNIIGNTVLYNTNGIYLSYAHYNNIKYNMVSDNVDDGIVLINSWWNDVMDNTVSNNGDGIYIHSSNEDIITGNIISHNVDNGIYLSSSNGHNITDNTVSYSMTGIYLHVSHENRAIVNNVFGNDYGIYLVDSEMNTIKGNNASSNGDGIYLVSSDENGINGNTVWDNGIGIHISVSSNNRIYHNNILDNSLQGVDGSINNFWDAGYPSCGNYWSDYVGLDDFNGPMQNLPGGDWVGDTSYTGIGGGAGATDNYPLTEPDTDGDALPDSWEINGFDVNGDGVIDLDLPAMGADPNHKDMFIEVDAMVGRGPNPATVATPPWATPTGTVLDDVVVSFDDVPNDIICNPDGADGIRLHIQLDETDIPLTDFGGVDSNGDGVVDLFDTLHDFDNTKLARFGTPGQRADPNWANILKAKGFVYRYAIFGNTHSGTGSSGLAEFPGNDFLVTLGAWTPPGGTDDQQRGTFMHELGHNLHLHHGGGDGVSCKPNYHSVMNYIWQVPVISYATSWILDYSREAFPDLHESNLNENNGIGGHAGHQVLIGPPIFGTLVTMVDEQGPIDYNGNGLTTDIGVSRDLNHIGLLGTGPSPGQLLHGYSDWPNLWFRLSGNLNFASGVHADVIADELTFEQFQQLNVGRAEIDIDPDTLNLKSKGRWITGRIELLSGMDVNDVDVSTVKISYINGYPVDIPAESHPTEIGDHDNDGVPDMKVKFDREEVFIGVGPCNNELTIRGQLTNGMSFEGRDTIKVISPGR